MSKDFPIVLCAGWKHSSRGDRDVRVNYFELSLSFLLYLDTLPNINDLFIWLCRCSRSQKSSQNNSKRSYSPEIHEEFHTKRHHSEVENKGGIMLNLRSTRTSAKEAICEQVVRPRRSTRLLEGSF